MVAAGWGQVTAPVPSMCQPEQKDRPAGTDKLPRRPGYRDGEATQKIRRCPGSEPWRRNTVGGAETSEKQLDGWREADRRDGGEERKQEVNWGISGISRRGRRAQTSMDQSFK